MLTFDVDEDGLIRALKRTEDGLDAFVSLAARELEREVRQEAGKWSTRLAEPWDIEGVGPYERHVVAPEWWAHILAHGAQAHGARSGRMVFAVDGGVVSAERVSGTTARHFDEAAEARTRSRVDDILRRIVEEAT